MPPLAELQRDIARAVLAGDTAGLAPLLVGGTEPLARLAIHRHHYESSLTGALAQKFPAVGWLIGAEALASAAHAYVAARPPSAPCIAEYGEDFPALVAERVGGILPYLQSFAELESAVGRASIAVERAPLGWSEIASLGATALLDARLELQPGIYYTRSAWRIDELFETYLGLARPETFVLRAEPSALEVRGSRGNVAIERLADPVYELRSALAAGSTIADAAAAALERDVSFDPGRALRELVAAGLATAIVRGEPSTGGLP